MDFKLIRSTICICSLSILVILGMVLYVNYRESGNSGPSQETVAETGNDTPLQENESDGNIALNRDTRAFLRDEDFWDPDPEGYVSVEHSDWVRVSLIATSVQKDLRLQVVDTDGALVTGESFFVTVENVGQFKDLDKDGIIYIADLPSGDYQVSVDPLDGYYVATSGINVHVKEKLEYQTIEDISLFILSEDDIDPTQDTVSGHNLNGDVDDTERTTAYTGMDSAVMGIDVSSFNGEIDWERVKADGIDFAIIRCGYRGYTSGSLVEDKYFLRNIEGANAAGIQVGVYFFTQAVTEEEAVEEASMVITLCRDYQVDLPVFIDTESTGGSGRADALDKAARTAVCRAFCETMESEGYHAGIYASKNWINQMLDYSQLQKYVTWLAEYKENATYEGDYQFWQYTSNGWVDGVTGRVDLNIGNLSLANLNEFLVTAEEEAVTETNAAPEETDSPPAEAASGENVSETG